MVTQSNKSLSSCPFTSGGGFALYEHIPSYQMKHVLGYLESIDNTAFAPMAGYSRKRRGYPDITLHGFNHLTLSGTNNELTSGTSVSASVMANMISDLNAARMKIGKGSVGFINPALYANSKEFVKDITSGNTKCLSSGKCCSEGFSAVTGWDPASGLGSLNYG